MMLDGYCGNQIISVNSSGFSKEENSQESHAVIENNFFLLIRRNIFPDEVFLFHVSVRASRRGLYWWEELARFVLVFK